MWHTVGKKLRSKAGVFSKVEISVGFWLELSEVLASRQFRISSVTQLPKISWPQKWRFQYSSSSQTFHMYWAIFFNMLNVSRTKPELLLNSIFNGFLKSIETPLRSVISFCRLKEIPQPNCIFGLRSSCPLSTWRVAVKVFMVVLHREQQLLSLNSVSYNGSSQSTAVA